MNSEEKIRYQSRIWPFYGFLLLMLLTLVCGLGYKQLIQTDKYNERGKIQNHRRILTPGPRGLISDRKGKLLVSNKSTFSAVIFLSDSSVRRSFRERYYSIVKDYRAKEEKFNSRATEVRARGEVIQSYLDDLNRMLGRESQVDAKAISRHFRIHPLLPYPIISNLNREEFAILVESLPIESPVQIYAASTRHYPYESAAAHTLGRVTSSVLSAEDDLKGSDLRTFATKGSFGTSGVEKYYDNILRGKTGMEIWVVDPAGFQVERIQNQYPDKGQDIQLSIDIDLQRIAEAGFDQYDDAGGLVLLDIDSMEVLAMVSKPDYNLNDTAPFLSNKVAKDIQDRSAWQNRAIQGLYSPASPFKLITATAGLKSGVIDENTRILCEGSIRVGGRRMHCHNHNGHGELNLVEAISASCNVFFYTVAMEMGIDALSSEAIFLGMNEQTGIDLPHEASNMLVPTREWKKQRRGQNWFIGDTANTAIGQGFLLFTPLQMAIATASIGKNQVLGQPSILKRSPENLKNDPPRKSLGLLPAQHQLIIDGLAMAAREGTARNAKLDNVNIGGKTGTGQIHTPEGQKELAWYVALAPIENPKIALAVAVEPYQVGSHGGGVFAAPMAKPVLEAYFLKHPELTNAVVETP